MGQSTGAARTNSDTQNVGQRVARALRESVGLGQPGGMPPKQLAREMGVHIDTVYGWAAGAGIRGEHLVMLFQIMPAHFGNIVLTGTGCTLVKLDETRRAAEAAIAEHRRAVDVLRQTSGQSRELARHIRAVSRAISADASLAAAERELASQDAQHAEDQKRGGAGLHDRRGVVHGNRPARARNGALVPGDAASVDGVVK